MLVFLPESRHINSSVMMMIFCLIEYLSKATELGMAQLSFDSGFLTTLMMGFLAAAPRCNRKPTCLKLTCAGIRKSGGVAGSSVTTRGHQSSNEE